VFNRASFWFSIQFTSFSEFRVELKVVDFHIE